MSETSATSGIAKVAMVVAVMLAMMLEMLDMTVVNVALPHMMGSFGATNDQITWVVTSYMVSSAVVMPLTGYLSERFGRRRLLLIDITLFLLASSACGASQTLDEMVFFRLLQGAAGATLAPLSQSVMMSTFTPETRGSAMAYWGLGMMVVPVLGPTLGGFLTDQLNWRWVFYINIPMGAFALLLASAYVPGDPGQPARTDWFGMVLLVLFIGSLQLMLSEGNTRDWFNSDLIQALALIATITGLGFISHCWDRPGAIVNLAVYRDRNFALSTLLSIGFALSMYGTMTLLPLMLEQAMHYPAEVVGMVMAPRGLIMAVAMMAFGRFSGRFDGRGLMVLGILVLGSGSFVYTLLPMNASPVWVTLPGLLQGTGMAMFFIPSAMMAYETLPKHLFDGAAGLYSVTRTIGSSVGIAVIGLLLTRRDEYHWQVLRANVTPYNPNVYRWMEAHGMSLGDPRVGSALGTQLMEQAQALTFGDLFLLVAAVPVLLAPIVLFRRRATLSSGQPANNSGA